MPPPKPEVYLPGDVVRSIRVRILPLAIALIAVATVTPLGLRHFTLSPLDFTLGRNPIDLYRNIILYFPLGLALGRSRFVSVGLFTLGAAAMAETLQVFAVGRIPSLRDVLANGLGALLGWVAARLWQRRFGWLPERISVGRRMAVGAIVVAILFGSLPLAHTQTDQTDFSNWDPSFKLVAGDEITGNRRWSGTIRRIVILPVSLDAALVGQIPAHGSFAPAALESLFPEPPVFQWDGALNQSPPGLPLLGPEQSLAFFGELVRRSELTVLVWMRTANVNQAGPARILTYSRDTRNSNFTLGQQWREVHFRLRTPASGPVGMAFVVATPPILSAEEDVFVAATYDGRSGRLYQDGRLAGTKDFAAPLRLFPLSGVRALFIALLAGTLLAAGFLGLMQTAAPTWWWGLALSGGLLGGVLICLTAGPSFGRVPVVVVALSGVAGGGLVAASASLYAVRRHGRRDPMEG